MKDFTLEMCDECSVWEPTVTCNKTGKIMTLYIGYCNEEDNYQLDSTALDEGCIGIDEPVKKPRIEMEKFIKENFTILENAECIPFSMTNNFCPECNDSVEPGLLD